MLPAGSPVTAGLEPAVLFFIAGLEPAVLFFTIYLSNNQVY
jgi:hypothetical protein